MGQMMEPVSLDMGEVKEYDKSGWAACGTKCEREHNVVNSLSRRFYLKHGVEHIVDGLDLWATTVGERVMESSYCIRREIGECLKKGAKLRDRLYIEHGRHRYRLDFDCAKCRMSLIDCTNNENRR
jgi:putative protease